MQTIHATVGIADLDGSVTARRVVAGLQALPGFVIIEDAPDRLRVRAASGRLSAIVVLPSGLTQTPAASVTVEGASQAAALVRAVLPGLVAEGAPGARLVVGQTADRGPSSEPVVTAIMLPGVVGMVIASVGLFGFGARLAAYRQRGFLRRLAVTPLGVRQFVLAQSVHRVLFMIVQSILLIVIGRYVLGASGALRSVSLLCVLVAGSLAFLGFGFFVGGIAPSGEAASGWCHLLYFPMLLVSGAWYPPSALPGAFSFVSPVLPMTYLLDGLQRSLGGIADVRLDVLVLACWAVAMLSLSARTFSPEPNR
jgi:ABC-2 type transport system permease protein